MAMPSAAINRFDLSLSYNEFSLLANRRGFIGLQALPAVPVALQSASFMKVAVEALLRKAEDTKRAPKATYSRDDYEWTTDTYKTEDHGAEEILDDRTLKLYGNEIRSEQIHVQRAINRVLMAYENDAAAAVFNTSTWTGSSLTTAVSTAWTTAASAVPITDIDTARESVRSSCGMKPNALIISDYALLKLARTAQVQDLLKYSGRDDPKNLVLIGALQELLQLDQILVGEGYKNTADQGQTASFSRLWDTTMAMVCRVADPGNMDVEDPDPCIGRTMMWTDENGPIPGVGEQEMSLIMEEYREENRRGGVIRARNDRQVKIIHAEAGHLLTAVTA